jgi:integration host factor subunit beta
MTKSQLIDEVALRVPHLTKKHVEIVVNTFFDSVAGALADGGDGRVEIRGFGSFSLRSRRGGAGRNPKTGEKVSVPPKKVPYFKAGKELKERLKPIK